MDSGQPRKPLLTGRGLVLVDTFREAAGLDPDTVEGLAADGRLEAAFRPSGELVGFFDDVLPSAEQLRGWGLTVRDDYDPEALRSYVDHGDDGDDDAGSPHLSSWTMGWSDER